MKNKKVFIISAFLVVLLAGLLIFFNTPYRKAGCLVNAIRKEDYDKVEELLNDGVDPNVTTASDITEFILNLVESTGQRPLSVACEVGNLEIVKLLIDYGATAESYDKCGWSPLRQTLFYYQPDDVEIVKLLLDNGADSDFEEDKLPVFAAADMIPKVYDKNKTNGTVFLSEYDVESAKGITEIVSILLDDKSVNIKTKLGETLLIKAVKRENIYLIEYLLVAGSEINSKDIYGKSAIDYAIELGNENIISLLTQASS